MAWCKKYIFPPIAASRLKLHSKTNENAMAKAS